MGILRIKDVSDWHHAALDEERALTAHPDDAGPIGRRAPSPRTHSATWIQLDPGSGDLVYGPEISIEVYRGHDKLLPKDLQERLGTREIRGWLFQVRRSSPNPQPDSFDRLDGKEILLSKLPHSRNYFLRRTLKPCKHERAIWDQVARAWDKHPEIRYTDERLDVVLKQLSLTPFISHKDCRAAWAVMPKRFDVLGVERFDVDDDYTIAALDMPFDEAYDLLRVHPSLQRALDLTDSGHLFDRYDLAKDVRAAIQHGLRPAKGPVYRCVTEELYENRCKVLKAACWAALCGRETPETDASVARSAFILYQRFAYNFVDRQKNPTQRPFQQPQYVEARAAAGTSEFVDFSEGFREEQERRDLTAQWREKGPDKAFQDLKSIVVHILRASEDSIDEVFVRTLRPAIAAWPPGWRRPEGFDKALQRLNRHL